MVFLLLEERLKKFAGVLSWLIVLPAYAATMCVPDLSSCESCGALGSNGPIWYADCCGTNIVGSVGIISTVGSGRDKIYTFSDLDDQMHVDSYMAARCVCFILSPARSISVYSLDADIDYNYTVCATKCAADANHVLKTLYQDKETSLGPDID